MSEADEYRAAVRLTRLPFMTATRLRALLRANSPTAVVEVLSGRAPATNVAVKALLERAPTTARHTTLGRLWRDALRPDTGDLSGVVADDIKVHVLGRPGYPELLALDPAAPAVVFTRGRPGALNARRVAIVGTRNATEHGRRIARRLGAELSEAGVAVVSGLARGIDGSAHRGVLAASDEPGAYDRGAPIGVVASGLDVVYPREHADLWHAVATRGLLCSEVPPGTAPEAFRFPMRNRIIAALSEVVVVVESRLEGGSLITVREAMRRGVTVMAVPGSTGTRAADGTNLLIRDGAHVVIDTADVLTVLGLSTDRIAAPFDSRPRPTGVDALVFDVLGAEPSTLDDIAGAARRRHDLSLTDTAVALGRLESTGWVMCTSGWFERR
ncbi:MAG: DNA-processing protein DprA [Acidimicrobiia bacterium]